MEHSGCAIWEKMAVAAHVLESFRECVGLPLETARERYPLTTFHVSLQDGVPQPDVSDHAYNRLHVVVTEGQIVAIANVR